VLTVFVNSMCYQYLQRCNIHFTSKVCSLYVLTVSAEALGVSSKEIRLEVNDNKTKYMVMSGDQNEGRSHSKNSDNSIFEMVGEFKH
jgi:hypothetical protein